MVVDRAAGGEGLPPTATAHAAGAEDGGSRRTRGEAADPSPVPRPETVAPTPLAPGEDPTPAAGHPADGGPAVRSGLASPAPRRGRGRRPATPAAPDRRVQPRLTF
eukprot:10580362-Alexandrium_andersonii.AAC.1